MLQWIGWSLFQDTSCCLLGAKTLHTVLKMRRSVIQFALFLINVVHTHIFKPSPVALELYCADSSHGLRGFSDIECAVRMLLNHTYDYAFTVRNGQCYACRRTDATGPYHVDEQLFQGPHYLRGGDNHGATYTVTVPSLLLCSLWGVQIVGCVLACRSYSFCLYIASSLYHQCANLSDDIDASLSQVQMRYFIS